MQCTSIRNGISELSLLWNSTIYGISYWKRKYLNDMCLCSRAFLCAWISFLKLYEAIHFRTNMTRYIEFIEMGRAALDILLRLCIIIFKTVSTTAISNALKLHQQNGKHLTQMKRWFSDQEQPRVSAFVDEIILTVLQHPRCAQITMAFIRNCALVSFALSIWHFFPFSTVSKNASFWSFFFSSISQIECANGGNQR